MHEDHGRARAAAAEIREGAGAPGAEAVGKQRETRPGHGGSTAMLVAAEGS